MFGKGQEPFSVPGGFLAPESGFYLVLDLAAKSAAAQQPLPAEEGGGRLEQGAI